MIILIQISPLLLDQSLCLRLKQSLHHLKYSLDKSDDHNDLDDDDDGCGDGDDDGDDDAIITSIEIFFLTFSPDHAM